MTEQKRMVLAVILSAIVLFGWQQFFSPPEAIIDQAQTTTSAGQTKTGNTNVNTTSTGTNTEAVVNAAKEQENFYTLQTDSASVEISNHLTIRNFTSNLSLVTLTSF